MACVPAESNSSSFEGISVDSIASRSFVRGHRRPGLGRSECAALSAPPTCPKVQRGTHRISYRHKSLDDRAVDLGNMCSSQPSLQAQARHDDWRRVEFSAPGSRLRSDTSHRRVLDSRSHVELGRNRSRPRSCGTKSRPQGRSAVIAFPFRVEGLSVSDCRFHSRRPTRHLHRSLLQVPTWLRDR